ncbi:MAG: hypothetical protein FJY07_11880 [Bacteroidetes bacterium]|nr:hypothetical protein [Bacteroidota bacterium]
MKKICLFISILLLLSACASKRFTKKAAKFEQAGLVEDAASYYYLAVKKNPANVDAKLGLHKTGQQSLDRKLADFMVLYQQGDYQQSVYKYIIADDFFKKLKAVGVDLSFPDSYKSYYEEAKGDFLNKKYIEGVDKLNREEFTDARVIFEEIKKIDGNYKDVQEKFVIARYEPVYREANRLMDDHLYRQAYYKFGEIITGAKEYKQAAALKDEAREKATITILATDFTYSHGSQKAAASALSAKLKDQLLKLNNPFLRLIDPASVGTNLYENGRINMQTANLAGIIAILSGNVSEATTTEGQLKKTTQRGYIKEVTKEKNAAGEEVEKVKYHKTEYFEYENQNQARLGVSFKLTGTETGVVFASDLFTLANTDKVHYATFSGEKKNLVPGYWKNKNSNSQEDKVRDNWGDVQALKSLMNANQQLKPVSLLTGELVDQSAKRIAEKINTYNPEKQ